MKLQKHLRNLIVLILFSLPITIGGCTRRKDTLVDNPQTKIEDMQYETGNVTVFCVDEQGKIYTCEEGMETINVYDAEGTKLSEIPVDGGTGSGGRYGVLCAGDGVLYASDCVEKGIVAIDIATGKRELLYATQDPNYWNLLDMIVCNGNLYFMYQKPVELAEMQLLSDYEAGYSYIGERVVCLEFATKKAEELKAQGVKRLCKKSDDEILFYAFDDENGFSYRVYDTETGSYSAEYEAKQELDLRTSAVMTYDASMERLLYPDSVSGQLRAIDITKKASETEFYDTGLSNFGTHSLQCINGSTYFLANGRVMRIDNGSYIVKTEPLKIVTVSSNVMPISGLGYELDVEELDSETIAMKLLAGDSDFDLLLLSSEYDLARQIENIGAYVPLNGIEEIETYFESSFDYIGEAAKAENGAVWMLPYEVDCDVLIYQPKLCEQYGIDFTGDLTFAEFVDSWEMIEKVAETDSIKYHVWFKIWRKLLEYYLADYAVVDGEVQFDSELFRAYAPVMKKSWERKRSIQGGPGNFPDNTEEGVRKQVQEFMESIIFTVPSKSFLEMTYGLQDYVNGVFYTADIFDFDFFEARSMPSIEEGKKQSGVAYAKMCIINPNSDRKEEIKEYLAALADSLTKTESIYRTKELEGEYTKLELQVHEVYGDAKVFFDYPSDVVGSEYANYITGEIDLEELIREAERKFNIYLKE